MKLVIVDKNKNRMKEVQALLDGSPYGQGLESFTSADKAINWCSKNECQLLLIDQKTADEQIKKGTFNELVSKMPVLILKDSSTCDFDIAQLKDFIGPKIDKTSLINRINNLIHIHLANQQLNKANLIDKTIEEKRFALAVNAANDGVWDWNIKTQQIFFSQRWLEIIGYHEGDIDINPVLWFSRVHPDDVSLLDTAIDAHLRGATDRLVCEYRLRHKNGFYRWVLTRGRAILDSKGVPVRLVGSQTDLTDRKISEEQLAHNALHDPLTGLANRALLMERLRQILLHQRRDPTHLSTVMFIDLDKFKQVNDNLGHEAGDDILKVIAQRLVSCCRENDTIARIGGDEFVLLVTGEFQEEEAISFAKRVIAEIDKPIIAGNETIHIAASIGIVLDTKDYNDPEAAIRDADLALYHAKTNGRHRYEVFAPSMSMNKSQHFILQSTLSGAIDRRELLMHFQPILDLATGKLVGFEALMRWRHPENGFIYPLDFIPIAEETGLINELGAWGFNAACKQLVELKKQFIQGKDWYMAVNVSGRQLQNDNFQKHAADTLSHYSIDPKTIYLEITENALMLNVDIIAPHIHGLKDLGVNLAIDDFGTGYSSLAIINDFPFDVLKIPREFIMDIHLKPKNFKTVKLIELLARETNMLTVAEGIEKIEELAMLQQIKYDHAQGYLFSKPLSTLDLTHKLSWDSLYAFAEEFKDEKMISKK